MTTNVNNALVQFFKSDKTNYFYGMISFDNTEIAFRSKSNSSLNRAYWLFRIIGNPSLVKMGKSLTMFALKFNLPVKGMIKRTIFAQFCGGENIAECSKTIDQLANFGIGTILDYSVEGKTSDEDFETTVNEIIDTIYTAARHSSIPFAVFKVTGIAEFSVLEKSNKQIEDLNDSEKEQY
jgi:proline dehydrogenase